MHANITLSKLVSDKKNPRRVKPQREAHKRLVASIRAFGLLEPLVVRPAGNDGDEYQVVAGERRLAALREIHRKDKSDPKIACQVRKVDDPTAEAMSLSENFAREAMHPLDEAEAFAELASLEGKHPPRFGLFVEIAFRVRRRRSVGYN
jgi:ParB family chromosome partitioning protein